jgi:hypothetical protein
VDSKANKRLGLFGRSTVFVEFEFFLFLVEECSLKSYEF